MADNALKTESVAVTKDTAVLVRMVFWPSVYRQRTVGEWLSIVLPVLLFLAFCAQAGISSGQGEVMVMWVQLGTAVLWLSLGVHHWVLTRRSHRPYVLEGLTPEDVRTLQRNVETVIAALEKEGH